MKRKYLQMLVTVLIIICTVMVQPVAAAGATVDTGTSQSQIVIVSFVNQIPDPGRAGELMEIRLRVENKGGQEVNDYQMELVPKYPFLALAGEQYVQTIDKLSAYQQGDNAVILKYKVMIDKNAVNGANAIGIRQGKKGSTSLSSVTQSFNVDIRGVQFAQIIYVDKAILQPGKETKLNFTVTNIGNAPLQDLIFSWREPNGAILPVYSDDTKYVKHLDAGESAQLQYSVVADVNTAPGLYKLDLSLKFDTGNGTATQINTVAGVLIGGETDFDVSFSESSAGQTTLSVANTGNTPATSVTVSIPPQDNFRVTGSASSIIGNLDKGDYTVVSFQIVSASSFGNFTRGTNQRNGNTASGQQAPPTQNSQATSQNGARNNLLVRIDYTDTTGARRSIEKSVPIQFRTASTTGTTSTTGGFARAGANKSFWKSTTFYVLIALVVIVGIGVWYFKYHKNRTKK